MRVTVLGCGSSGGTPMPGPEGWGECDPADPRNLRRRPSILVESATTRILVDTSPDLRVQLLDAGVWRVDAILYTHAHADHTNGIDDIRALNYHAGGPLDAYASAATLDILKARFPYVFEPYASETPQFWRPCLRPQAVDGPFRVGDIDIRPFEQAHGRMPSLGFRFGRFAYSTDVKTLSEAAFAVLDGIEVWVVDCLGETPHPTHSHLAQTLGWIERLGPRHAVLTHLSHRTDYAKLAARLPAGVEPGRDGMVIDVPE